ncbi:MAG: glycosyltransferase [Candidatus Roizmanbacteria bacterium]|nr:glycosyltransferase [Candidatus Roizmanbacteria bacterium]
MASLFKHISIIIPSYNRVDQTIRTIKLLQKSQGIGKDFQLEIIVSDSSPNTKISSAITNLFGKSIRYTRPKKPGIASNKNAGAQIASSPVLIFCDSDMEVEKDTVKNAIYALMKNPSGAAATGQIIWRGGPKADTLDRPRPEDRMLTYKNAHYVEAIYSRFIITYTKIFHSVGGYDETFFNMRGEGSDLSVRYWRAGFPLIYDEKIRVHHVYEVEGGIIRGIDHPEWGIAKDLFLLGCKYDMFQHDWKNFSDTIEANFKASGTFGYFRILQGIASYYDFIVQMNPLLKSEKLKKPLYDFKFLEVFSDKENVKNCIQSASKHIAKTVKGLK